MDCKLNLFKPCVLKFFKFKLGVMQVMKTKEKEWNNRIKQIEYWIENPSEKTIEIVELFY